MFRCMYCDREFDQKPLSAFGDPECPGCGSGKILVTIASGESNDKPDQRVFAESFKKYLVSSGSMGYMSDGQYFDFSGYRIRRELYEKWARELRDSWNMALTAK